MNVNGSIPHLPVRPDPVAPARPAAAVAGGVAAPAKGNAPAKPSDAREGALWDVLTPEERDWFQQQAQLGPLTYGRPQGSAASASAPRGQRLDVRG